MHRARSAAGEVVDLVREIAKKNLQSGDFVFLATARQAQQTRSARLTNVFWAIWAVCEANKLPKLFRTAAAGLPFNSETGYARNGS